MSEEIERKSWPTWRYRGVDGAERKIFGHPDDVPEGEGWVDSPAKCQGEPEPVMVVSEDATETFRSVSGLEPVNIEDAQPDMVSMSQVRARYTEVTHKRARVGKTKAEIQQMTRDHAA